MIIKLICMNYRTSNAKPYTAIWVNQYIYKGLKFH